MEEVEEFLGLGDVPSVRRRLLRLAVRRIPRCAHPLPTAPPLYALRRRLLLLLLRRRLLLLLCVRARNASCGHVGALEGENGDFFSLSPEI